MFDLLNPIAVDNKVNPREYIGKFWVDSLVHDQKALSFLVDTMGEDRVILGSDYPFPLGEDHPGQLVESSTDLSDAVKHKILEQNALDFLGLERDAFLSGDDATPEALAETMKKLQVNSIVVEDPACTLHHPGTHESTDVKTM